MKQVLFQKILWFSTQEGVINSSHCSFLVILKPRILLWIRNIDYSGQFLPIIVAFGGVMWHEPEVINLFHARLSYND